MDYYSASSSIEVLTEGIIEVLKPTLEELDERVLHVRQSQMELKQNIDCLTEDLKKIREQQQTPIELDSYLKKLSNSRRRVMLVSNILQNLQERMSKLHFNVSKETARRKALLDPPTAGPPL
jgi:DNA repair exonuclease SbcCD ATPase subunit